jgi:hypothetical protein
LSIENIVKEVKAEISRLQQVLTLLGAESGHGAAVAARGGSVSSGVVGGKPRRKMSAAGRKRIAIAQRKRWAAIRAAKR